MPFDQRDPNDESSQLVIGWKDESLNLPYPWRRIETGMHGAADADHHSVAPDTRRTTASLAAGGGSLCDYENRMPMLFP